MTDESHLDNKYFLDEHVYNCPFCKRGNVAYNIIGELEFDWTKTKNCHVYIAKCDSCYKRSMHLSFNKYKLKESNYHQHYKFVLGDDKDLDSKMFYSVPTSFFALDSRIPKLLRELFTEAEGCMKSNFLTGASACVRKIIYELAVLEEASGDNYEERLKSLKEKRDDVEPEYFDTLLTIQQLTSTKVHEQSYDGWENQHIKILMSTLSEVLYLMYVIPEVRKEKRNSIVELKNKLTKDS